MSEREILFRGQTRRKGEKVRISGEPVDSNWVYGGIFPGEGDFSIIYQAKPKIEKFTVYSDTVGQFTGLTDKNGKKIFEGDIVKTSHGGSTYYAKIEWDDGSFWVTNHDIQMPSYISEVSKTYLEVIGNIHDNPELLKGE